MRHELRRSRNDCMRSGDVDRSGIRMTEDVITYVAGYEFKNGSYTDSDQYKRYRAALEEIHLLAVKLQRERGE